MSSSTKIDNRKKDILILGKDPTHLSLHYNRTNSYLFVNGKEILKFKAKDSKVISTPLCLGNISKDWSVDNMKKTGLDGNVYDFNVDYDAIVVDDILDIPSYLMKKNDSITKCLGLLKGVFYRINFNKRSFVGLYFNEQSRM